MTEPVDEVERKRRRIERSRKGGLALKAKYGRDHFVWMGQRGGRPTWQDDLAQARARESEPQAKGGGRRSKPSGVDSPDDRGRC